MRYDGLHTIAELKQDYNDLVRVNGVEIERELNDLGFEVRLRVTGCGLVFRTAYKTATQSANVFKILRTGAVTICPKLDELARATILYKAMLLHSQNKPYYLRYFRLRRA